MFENNPKKYNVAVIHNEIMTRDVISQILKNHANIAKVEAKSNLLEFIKIIKQEVIDLIIIDATEISEFINKKSELDKYLPKNSHILVTVKKDNASQVFIALKAIAKSADDYIELPDVTALNFSTRQLFADYLSKKISEQLACIYKENHPDEFKINIIKTDSVPPTAFKKSVNMQDFNNNPSNLSVPIRNSRINRPKAIAIAASTGGPHAINQIFSELKGEEIIQPIFITLHINETFSKLFVESLSSISGRECYEATDHMSVKPGAVYMAPGDYHMIVEPTMNQPTLRLDQSELINFCRPSADPMLETLADIYGDELLVIILTGMGSDGLEGAKYAATKGATIIAQDQASSVVWGMPAAVAKAGICNAIIPLEQIPCYIQMIGAS